MKKSKNKIFQIIQQKIKGAVAKYYDFTIYRYDIPNIHPVYGKNLLFCNSRLFIV